ncbi:uncharacterized protein LAESUDRAFT_60188 [Laetiporus sulphureus 93-53]|uniref:Uncharacterized protein n=1 Tax=Laetiporus sulphureus 93-53 TaxID=1314785 RepID=A0A165AXJ2_9APHY|nr:uncharacterized protein LAESUDRAFT_60188 [Laetiporus sulphureus 93-53]KZS99847.1 hypothetical protein LAESUDRAFT_60188 [Laetiporus sulphureus 93-53]
MPRISANGALCDRPGPVLRSALAAAFTSQSGRLAPVPTSHLSHLASLSRTSAFLTVHSSTFASIVHDREGRRGCASYMRPDAESRRLTTLCCSRCCF